MNQQMPCLHLLEGVRVVAAFEKIFENKHQLGDVRVFCTNCGQDLPKGSTQRKIAIKLLELNIKLVAKKEEEWT